MTVLFVANVILLIILCAKWFSWLILCYFDPIPSYVHDIVSLNSYFNGISLIDKMIKWSVDIFFADGWPAVLAP